MKPNYKDIKQLKNLFVEISRNKHDPKKEALIKANKEQITFELKNYGFEDEEDFARNNSFCVSCGCGLNSDNDCHGCGRQFGW